MNKIIIISILIINVVQLFGQDIPDLIERRDINLGHSAVIYSNALKEDRVLNIYLPAGYDEESQKEYPVIYLLDGSIDEDFIHIAGIIQFGSFPWIDLIPESILVGISNVDRKRDFTYPSENLLDQKEFPTTGGSTKFIDFIENEVKPFINEHYRAKAEATIIGQSLGGLLASQILFDRPRLFDAYIIVSPSLWWDDENFLSRNIEVDEKPKNIYIAVGNEGEIMGRTARTLYNNLKNSPIIAQGIQFDYLADKSHGDVLHIAVYNAFTYFKVLEANTPKLRK